MKLRLPLLLASLLMASFSVSPVFAEDYTWTGAASANAGEGGNWQDQTAGPVTFWDVSSTNKMILGAGANKDIRATADMGLGGITVNTTGYSLKATDSTIQSLFLNAAAGSSVVMDINENFTLNGFKAIQVNADVSIDIASGKLFTLSALAGGAGKTISVVGNKATASANPFTSNALRLGTNAGLVADWAFSGGVTVELWNDAAGSSAGGLGTGSLTFDNAAVLFASTNSETIANNIIIKEGGLVMDNGGSNTLKIFSGKFTGKGKFTKGGNPTVNLTFTGDWSEFAGEFNTSKGEMIFDTAAVSMNKLVANSDVIFKQGTLKLNALEGNGLKIGATNAAAVVTLDMGTASWDTSSNIEIRTTSALTVQNAATNTLSGIISGGTGILKKSGAGTLILTGANTYGGLTTVEAGSLQIGAGGAAGTLGSGAVMVELGASLAFNRNDAVTIAHAIGGAGNISFLGAATSVYSLTGPFTLTGSIIMGGGATLKFDKDTTVSNKITGSGIIEIAQGTLSLKGVNDFAGTVRAATGATVKIGAEAELGTGAVSVVLADKGTLDFDYTGSFSRDITLEGNGLLSVEAEKKVTLTSTASQTTGKTLTKTGAGELVLTSGGAGSSLAALVINAGTLTLQFGAGGASTVVSSLSTLTLGGGILSLDVNGQTGVIQNFASTSLNQGIASVTLQGTGLTLNFGLVTGTGKVCLSGVTGNTIQALGTAFQTGQFFALEGGRVLIANAIDGVTGLISFEDGGYESLPSSGSDANKKYLLDGSGSVTESESAAELLLVSKEGDANTLTISDGKTLAVTGSLSAMGDEDYFISGGSLSAGTLEKGGSGTLTISSSLTANNITVSSGELLLTGGVVSTGTISIGSKLTIDTTTAGDQSLAGVLSGGGTLVKTGTGTLTLSGASAAYAGSIRVDGGKIAASIANNATSVDSLGSGSLYIGQGATVTVGDTDHVFGQEGAQNTNDTFAKTVTGAGTLELYLGAKENSTQHTVNLGNDFAGTLVIKKGMLALNKGNGDAFAINIGRGTLSMDGGTSFFIRNTAGGNFTNTLHIGSGEVAFRFYGNTNSTLSGKLTGSTGAIIKQQDGGKITLTGDMSEFGGTYNMDNGRVTFNSNGVVSLNTLIAKGESYLQSGTMVLENGFSGNNFKIGKSDGSAVDNPVTLSGTKDWSAAGNIELKGTSQLIVDTRKYDVAAKAYGTDGISLTLSGIVSGATGTLKKSGAGTLILTGANTYGGLTTVSGGTLQLGNGGTTGAVAGEISVDAGAFVAFSLSGTRAIGNKLVGAGTAKFMGTGAVYTLTNTANTISEYLIESGTLKVTPAGMLGTSKVRIQGGTLELAVDGDFTNNIVLDAGTGNAKLSSTATGAGAVVKGTITGTGNLEKTGAGVLILDDGANSTGQIFTGGVVVSAGTLQLGQASGTTGGRNIAYGTGEMTVRNGARLSLAFADQQTINTLTNKVVLENGGALYLSNSNVVLGGGLKAGAAAADSTTLLFKYDHTLTLNTALEGTGTLNLSESGESTEYSRGGGGLVLTQDSTSFSGKIVVGAPTADTSINRYGLYLRLDSVKAAYGADIELKAASQTGGKIANTQLQINVNNAEIGGLTGDAGTLLLSGATKNTGDGVARNLILNGTGTFSGSIDTKLTLTKRGAGTTQTLAGGVVLLGGTSLNMTVESGTLALGTGSDTLGAGLLASSYTVQTGGILQINRSTANANASTVTGTVDLNGGELKFASNLDGNCFAQKVTFSANNGSITGGSNNASHRGWILSHGASAEADAAVVTVDAGITGSQISAGKIYFQNTTEAGAAIFNLAVGSSLSLTSAIAGPDANAAFKIRGGGTLIYTGDNNGSDQAAVKAIVENGTLQIGNGGTTGSWGNGANKQGAIQLGATGAADGTGATLVFNRSDALTYGGVISGKGTVNFEGGANSIYTLQGVNTFTGTANINQGKVVADSTQSFGTGSTVNLKTGAIMDFARAQTDTTAVLNAYASSSIEHGANFNGKLNILANTAATAVNVTGGLGVSELSFTDGSTLNVTGNVTGGKAVLNQNATLTITSGNLSLTSLEIKSHTSHVNVGGNVSITNGGYLYLNQPTANAPLVTATGSVTLAGTFLLGFNANDMTTVGEYDFTLFQGSSYSGIQAKLDFQNQAERSFYYLNTDKFATDGIVTVVKTDWGYNLVNAQDIAGMGGNYAPADGKELLGSKSVADGGGTRDNPLNFNIAYTPVANADGVTAYRLTDGDGWMNFQTQMTGAGVGLVIQGNQGFTGDAAEHGLIISNNSNNYAGGTSVLNTHVVLDSSLAADEGDKLTGGTIGMLGTGAVTFIGNLSELELRPNGNTDGEFTFANNLTLKDGAALSQTGGTNTLTGNLTLQGTDGGVIKNATSNSLTLAGSVVGSKLTLTGNGVNDTSVIELTNAGEGNTVQVLVLDDMITFAINGGNLTAGTIELTSGNIDITNGGSLLTGGITGAVGSTITLNGGTLGTAETGSGTAIVLGGANNPAITINGTGNTIIAGNREGLELRDLTGTGTFDLKGGRLTLAGGTVDSHFSGIAAVGENSLLTVAQNAYMGGSITTTALDAAAITVLIQGGASAAQRTTVGDLELAGNNMADLAGDHITLGDILIKGNATLGTTQQNAPSDVTASSLTIETEGVATFGDDLHITGGASLANGSLQVGDNALIDGDATLNDGRIQSTGSLSLGSLEITGTGSVLTDVTDPAHTITIDGDASIGSGSLLAGAISVGGNATVGNGSIAALDSLSLGSLEITGTGSVLTDATDPAHTITIDGDASIGSGSLLAGAISVDGKATVGNGSIAALDSLSLGSLEITGTGSVLTDTADLAHSISITGDAHIGNGSLQTGVLSIGGNTTLNNGTLKALADNAHIGGGLTITGAEGKAAFKNNTAINGMVDITGGSLTAGDDSSLGGVTLKGGRITLGNHAMVGSLHTFDGGIFTSGDNSSIAAGAGETISIGSGSTVTFGKNTTMGSAGSSIDISGGATVNFGAGTHIEGDLGSRGLTFASGSSYSGFLDVGTNKVTFENGSNYLLNGPVLQQYTTDTIGLQSTGTITIDNGTRFILGENLGSYSILEAPDTMTLIQATGDGKLLVGGEQVKEKGNYGYLLENADKYFEWLTFNLIGGHNSLDLEMVRFVRFETVATTANEKAMAPIANALGTGAAFYDGELKKLGSALALTAKGDGRRNLSRLALSNASLLSGYMAQTQEVRRHNFDLLTRASQEKTGAERLSYEQYNNTIWANGTGGTYTMSGDSNAAGYRTNQWGGTLGTSHGFSEHFVGGVAFSYTHSDTTVDGNYGTAKGDSYDIDLFGKYNRNNWNIIGAVTAGMTSLDTVRHLEIGDYSSRTAASGDGSHLLATLQVGYQFAVSDDLNSTLEPFALISGGFSSIDSLSERGAGNAGLTTESRDQSLCTIGAGVRFTREYFTNADENMKGRFEIRAMILQDLTDVDGNLTASYQGMNERFRLEGAASSRLGVVAGVGIVQPLTQQTSIFGDVDGEFRSGENGVRANIGVKYNF